jgi:hypothetical protein
MRILMAAEIRLMNTSELLDRIFFYYRKYFLLFVGITAIPLLAPLLVQLGFIGLQSSSSQKTTIIIGLLSFIVQLAAYSIAQGATICAISDIHLGHVASIHTAFTGIRGSLVKIGLTLIFSILLLVIGFILLIIPAFFLMIALSLAIPAVIIENITASEAIRRSFSLTQGRRFRIFVICLLVGGIAYIISFVINSPVLVMIGILGFKNAGSIPIGLNILSAFTSFISSCLAMPISTIAISIIYYDQRVRKEGFDLQLMMSSLESEPSETTVPTIY